MSAYIAKQPNGLYCRFSSVVDCPTHYNMTTEDYLSNVTGTVSSRSAGKDVLDNHLQPFQNVIDDFTTLNMSQSEFEIILEQMYKIGDWKSRDDGKCFCGCIDLDSELEYIGMDRFKMSFNCRNCGYCIGTIHEEEFVESDNYTEYFREIIIPYQINLLK